MVLIVGIVYLWKRIKEGKKPFSGTKQFLIVCMVFLILLVSIPLVGSKFILYFLDLHKPFSTHREKIDLVYPQIVYRVKAKDIPFISIVDLNNDGRNDIVCGTDVFVQGEDKGLKRTTLNYSKYDIKSKIYGIVVNEENRDELILYCEDGAYIIPQTKPNTLNPPKGKKRHSPPILDKDEEGITGVISASGAGDINGDGIKDKIFIVDYKKIVILIKTKEGKIDLSIEYYSPKGWELSNKMAVGDVTGDNRADIVVSGEKDMDIYIFASNRESKIVDSFEYKVDRKVPIRYFREIKIDDINNDGLNDIIVLGMGGFIGRGGSGMIGGHDYISIYTQREKGLFNLPISHSAGYAALSMAIGDINSDGKNDIVVYNFFSKTISVFINAN